MRPLFYFTAEDGARVRVCLSDVGEFTVNPGDPGGQLQVNEAVRKMAGEYFPTVFSQASALAQRLGSVYKAPIPDMPSDPNAVY